MIEAFLRKKQDFERRIKSVRDKSVQPIISLFHLIPCIEIYCCCKNRMVTNTKIYTCLDLESHIKSFPRCIIV